MWWQNDEESPLDILKWRFKEQEARRGDLAGASVSEIDLFVMGLHLCVFFCVSVCLPRVLPWTFAWVPSPRLSPCPPSRPPTCPSSHPCDCPSCGSSPLPTPLISLSPSSSVAHIRLLTCPCLSVKWMETVLMETYAFLHCILQRGSQGPRTPEPESENDWDLTVFVSRQSLEGCSELTG